MLLSFTTTTCAHQMKLGALSLTVYQGFALSHCPKQQNGRSSDLPQTIDSKIEPSRTRTCDPLVKSLKHLILLSLAVFV